MYFHDPEKRQTKELAPGVRTRTFWGKNLLLSVVELDPNSEVPNHTHPHEQGGMMLEGEMEMNIAGETRLLKPGDAYMIWANCLLRNPDQHGRHGCRRHRHPAQP